MSGALRTSALRSEPRPAAQPRILSSSSAVSSSDPAVLIRELNKAAHSTTQQYTEPVSQLVKLDWNTRAMIAEQDPRPRPLSSTLAATAAAGSPDSTDLDDSASTGSIHDGGVDIQDDLHMRQVSASPRPPDSNNNCHSQESSRPISSTQRACTHCQQHKIKCISAGPGPCARCLKKGLECRIAPRKKRISKKFRLSSDSSTILYSANEDHGGVSISGSDKNKTMESRIQQQLPAVSSSAQNSDYVSDVSLQPTQTLSDPRQILNNAGVFTPSEFSQDQFTNTSSVQESSRPHIVPSNFLQSSISPCSLYSVYLSPSLNCPGLFRRISDLSSSSLDISSEALSTAIPKSNFKMLLDLPTMPIFSISYSNDELTAENYIPYGTPQDDPLYLEWRQTFGIAMVRFYFNRINPLNPIIHRRRFVRAYLANMESPALLLAIFAASVIYYAAIGPLEQRKQLQTKIIRHLLSRYSYVLMMPSIDGVQTLSLVADSVSDRTVLMYHGAIVRAAVELRLHLDCSEWDLPGWERALRKALWLSTIVRDTWTTVRYVNTPSISPEYYSRRAPTLTELTQIVSSELYPITDSERAQVESSLLSFIAGTKIAEILADINRAFYQNQREFHPSSNSKYSHAAGASHVAVSIEGRLNESLESSFGRSACRGLYYDRQLFETLWAGMRANGRESWPDQSRHSEANHKNGDRSEPGELFPKITAKLLTEFARFLLYVPFLPHQSLGTVPTSYTTDFNDRFLDSIEGIIRCFKLMAKVDAESGYCFPVWISHVVLMAQMVLSDVLFAMMEDQFKARPDYLRQYLQQAEVRSPQGYRITASQKRSMFFQLVYHDVFSTKVLEQSSELQSVIGVLAKRWDQFEEIDKVFIRTARFLGVENLINDYYAWNNRTALPAGSGLDNINKGSSTDENVEILPFNAQTRTQQQQAVDSTSQSATPASAGSSSATSGSSSVPCLPPVFHFATVGKPSAYNGTGSGIEGTREGSESGVIIGVGDTGMIRNSQAVPSMSADISRILNCSDMSQMGSSSLMASNETSSPASKLIPRMNPPNVATFSAGSTGAGGWSSTGSMLSPERTPLCAPQTCAGAREGAGGRASGAPVRATPATSREANTAVSEARESDRARPMMGSEDIVGATAAATSGRGIAKSGSVGGGIRADGSNNNTNDSGIGGAGVGGSGMFGMDDFFVNMSGNFFEPIGDYSKDILM
ncbi:uncharacterized protein V1516DRAFT_683306 [Lipomyces oligophaga]|uniref:uncharacterized protein n=1 Tax=Lipomyces oligophaga TaxID=45792 RepID=UPI0034CD32EB